MKEEKEDKQLPDLYWKISGEKLTDIQQKSFTWVKKIFLKKPDELIDWEKEAQKMYTNIVKF